MALIFPQQNCSKQRQRQKQNTRRTKSCIFGERPIHQASLHARITPRVSYQLRGQTTLTHPLFSRRRLCASRPIPRPHKAPRRSERKTSFPGQTCAPRTVLLCLSCAVGVGGLVVGRRSWPPGWEASSVFGFSRRGHVARGWWDGRELRRQPDGDSTTPPCICSSSRPDTAANQVLSPPPRVWEERRSPRCRLLERLGRSGGRGKKARAVPRRRPGSVGERDESSGFLWRVRRALGVTPLVSVAPGGVTGMSCWV